MNGTTWEACLGLWAKGAFRQDISSEDTNIHVFIDKSVTGLARFL